VNVSDEAYVTVYPVDTSAYTFTVTRVYFKITAVELTAENLVLSGLDYTIGSEPSLTGVTAKVGDSTIAGTFAALTDAQIATIKALTEAGTTATIKVSFTPDASTGFDSTKAIEKDLVVTAKADASEQPTDPGTNPSDPGTTPTTPGTDNSTTVDNGDAVAKNEVTVVLSSYTVKATGKQLQPKVTVYTSTGAKLKNKTDYTVSYGTNTAVGEGTVTVKLLNSGYTFAENGSDEL
jgi:hypothetical protein